MRPEFSTLKTVAAAFAVGAALATSPAQAATLLVDDSGILLGATGLDIDGTFYDVSFQQGSCVSLFSGCDEATDFDFTTADGAVAAALALLESVFVNDPLGDFDDDPALTFGISTTDMGSVYIPYERILGFTYLGVIVTNGGAGSVDSFGLVNPDPRSSTLNNGEVVFARFFLSAAPPPPAPVPVPAGGLLLLAGLAGLAVCRRRGT